MKKIKKYIFAPVVFVISFLISRNILAAGPMQTLYGGPTMQPFNNPTPVVYGSPVYFLPATNWLLLILFPILPLAALIALIIGIVITLKRRDKKNPTSRRRSIKKIIIMIIGFIIFCFLLLIIGNYLTQTVYGPPPNLLR